MQRVIGSEESAILRSRQRGGAPMSVATAKFSTILWSFAQLMKLQARRHEKFRHRLCERNLVAQIKARDEEVGRWFEVRNGAVRSGAGFHNPPHIPLPLKSAPLAPTPLTPPTNSPNPTQPPK